MAESTVVYTPDNGGTSVLPWLTALSQRSGIDATTLLAMANGGFGGFGGGNGLVWLFFLWMMWQNGGWGGNGNNVADMISNNQGRDYLAQAIAGNHEAINNLAQLLHTDISTVQSTLNSVNLGLQQVGSQVGMSSLQVINSIQAGNADLASRMASCCCEVKQAIVTQGYEDRLATLAQTDALAAKIDAQTTMINDKFCQLEMRELHDKLDAARAENSNLRGEISQANQNAYITGFVGQAVAPINAHLAALSNEVDDIKCKLPNTVNVPYPQLTAVPTYAAYNMYANGYGWGNGFGYGYGNGGFLG